MKQVWSMGRVLACGLLLSLALVGCGGGGGGDATLVVGTEATFPPFELKNEAGEITGFDIDLIKAIAADQGLELDIRDMAFDGLIPALTTGQIDIALSAMSITEEREQTVDFTDPYINAGLVVAVRADDMSIKGVSGLKGKTVAVQIGTTGAAEAAKMKEAGDIKAIKEFANVGLSMQDLIQGGVAAVINDKPVSEVFVATQPGKVRLLDEVLVSDDYGMAVKQGNSELLEKLNAGLANIKANGTYDEITAAYFPADE